MKTYKQLKDILEKRIEEKHGDLVIINDDLADHPEISGEEYRSSALLVDYLRKNGYEVEYPYLGIPTAFKGVIGANQHKYKVAVMVEYDALPEIGHACGHCVSGSISILAGLALAELQDELDVDVHILGTPVEEVNGAKCKMAEEGSFDGYDMAMMVHMYDENVLAPRVQAMDSYLYHFYGKSSHASSMPWEGRNALNAVQLMFHAVDMMRQHVTPDVRLHGVVKQGGIAPNIVPEYASAEFYARALDRPYLNDVVRRMDDCARGAAIATQTTWKKEETAPPYDNLVHVESGIQALREVYEELELPITTNTERIFGSTDAGNTSYRCPTFHPALQLTQPGIPIHTRGFADAVKTEKAHDLIRTGARIISYQVTKIFSSSERIDAMKADFARAVKKEA